MADLQVTRNGMETKCNLFHAYILYPSMMDAECCETKMPSFAFRKTVFQAVKRGLWECERPPFAFLPPDRRIVKSRGVESV